MDSKPCAACGKVKPVSEFPPKPSGRYGVGARCRPCESVKQRDWRAHRVVKPRTERACPRCGEMKEATEFGDPSKGPGRPYCRGCWRDYNRERAHEKAGSVKPGATKRCSRCETTKPVSDFFRNASARDGLGGYCKPCWTAYLKDHEDPAGRARRMRAYGLKRFGLTIADYDAMLEGQGGCAICLQGCATGKRLAVDHDEATGRVRGLLCVRCNQGIGRFEHDPALLESAAAYLRVPVLA